MANRSNEARDLEIFIEKKLFCTIITILFVF